MIIETSAPSNIALIKYMGKISTQDNSPTNSSLSWTLEDLKTFVRITLRPDLTQDQWLPLKQEGLEDIVLSEKSILRFLNHFKNIKQEWKVDKNFLIESANNFPSDCGLASSASSFAALTKAAVMMMQKISKEKDLGIADIAEISRKGSGSSCRSFFSPWAMWYKEGVRPIEFPIASLAHQVIVVENQKKQVSSSEAHRRVLTSPLFEGRVERAEKRLLELSEALNLQNWKKIYEICWAEFWDMHCLFETSTPVFGYMEPASLEVLHFAKKIWSLHQDGPVVTMDAGANVHFLWRPDQLSLAKIVIDQFSGKYKVISSKHIVEVLA